MRKLQKSSKIISWLLVLSMVLGVFPIGTLASQTLPMSETGTEQSVEAEPNQLTETIVEPKLPEQPGEGAINDLPNEPPVPVLVPQAMEASVAPVISKDLSEKVVYNLNSDKPLAITATSGDGGTLTYQWQSSVDNKTFVNIANAIADKYIPLTNAEGTSYYKVIVTNTATGKSPVSVESQITALEVLPQGLTEVTIKVLHNKYLKATNDPIVGTYVDDIDVHFYKNNGFDANGIDIPGEEVQATYVGVDSAYPNYKVKTYTLRVDDPSIISYRATDLSDGKSLGGMYFAVPKAVELNFMGKPIDDPNIWLCTTKAYIENKKSEEKSEDGKVTGLTYFQPSEYDIRIMDSQWHCAQLGEAKTVTQSFIAAPYTKYDTYIHHTLLPAAGNARIYNILSSPAKALSNDFGGFVLENKTVNGGGGYLPYDFACHILTKDDIAITIPKGSTIEVFQQLQNFNTILENPTSDPTENEDKTMTYHYRLTHGNYMYRVSMPGKITKSGFISNYNKQSNVTFADKEDPKSTENITNATTMKMLENSTMLNINNHNHLKLNAVGDNFKVRAYRAGWQIVSSTTGNIMIEPDYHYNIISGSDIIGLEQYPNKSQWANLTAKKAGTAIVEVTYDAIDVTGGDMPGRYGAVNPLRTGVFVVTVGDSGDIDWNTKTWTEKLYGCDWKRDQWDSEFDTSYYLNTQDHGSFIVKPKDVKSVEFATLKNGVLSDWQAVSNKNFTYDVPVIAGINIVRAIGTNGKVDYLVVRAAQLTPKIENSSFPGEDIMPGDDVSISFDGLFMPLPKFSGIYNPGFGSVGMKVLYKMDDKNIIKDARGSQYDFINNNTLIFKAPDMAGEYNLTDGTIVSPVLGFRENLFGAHRRLTDNGTGANFNAGFTFGLFCSMPDISFNVVPKAYVETTFNIKPTQGITFTLFDKTGAKVEPTEVGGYVYSLGYGDYSYEATGTGYLPIRDRFTIASKDLAGKTIDLNVVKAPEGAWNGKDLTPVTPREDGVYEISTGAELAWLADQTKQAGNSNKLYSAVITKDICLGGHLWTPIGIEGYSGIFDGQGHTISDLYCQQMKDQYNGQGLFYYVCSNYGGGKTTHSVIKNLTVEGTVESINVEAAGIVANMDKGLIENCVNRVNVIRNNYYNNNNFAVGGIAADTSAEVRNCVNEGSITGFNNAKAGGIVGLYKTAEGNSINHCYNRGDVTGYTVAGGITAENRNKVANCYNIGKINVINFNDPYQTPSFGAILGYSGNKGEVLNSYYLKDSCTKGIGNKDDDANLVVKTSAELKVCAGLLGGNFISSSQEVNNGYPILDMQKPSISSVTINPTAQTTGPVTLTVNAHDDGMLSYSFDGGKTWVGRNTNNYKENITIGAETICIKDTAGNMVKYMMPIDITNIKAGGSEKPEKLIFGLNPGEIKGYVTVSFEDYGKRDSSGVEFPSQLGDIIPSTDVPFRQGDSMADVTLRLLDEKKIDYSYTGSIKNAFYLSAIKNFTVSGSTIKTFGEFSSGPQSGWMVSLNNCFVNQGVSEFTVEDGDLIKWQNTCQLGADIGCDWSKPSAKITGIHFQKAYGKLSPAFSDDETQYILTVPASVKGIRLEAEQENYWSIMTYTSDGKTYKPMREIPVSNGTKIKLSSAFVEFAGNKPTDTDELTITIQVSGSPAVSVDVPVKANSETIKPTVSISGNNATLNVSSADISNAIDAIKQNKSDELIIAPELKNDFNKVTANVSKSALADLSSKTSADLKVKLGLAQITFPHEALKGIVDTVGKDVRIVIEKADKSKLSAENKKLVGDKPVFDISVLVDNKPVSQFNGKITISIPYELKKDEDPKKLTVYYIDANGKAQEMAGAYYDAASKSLIFKTNHLSVFAVVYDQSKLSFSDVSSANWFYDAVKFVVANNLFQGTTSTAFEPNAKMNRAMLATVLYRLDGSPAVTATNQFTDVAKGAWYSDAIAWAQSKSIIKGYGEGIFGVKDSVTREQAATILYNYAKYKGYDVAKTKDISAYSDFGKVATWAKTPLAWANAQSLISGRTAQTLAPKDTATRAEIASILQRFVNNIAK